MALHLKPALVALALLTLSWAAAAAQDSSESPADSHHAQAPQPASDNAQPSDHHPGSISGTVVDPSGAVVPGAAVQLNLQPEAQPNAQPNIPLEIPRDVQRNAHPTGNHPVAPPAAQSVVSGTDGRFSFTNVPPGPFQLNVTSAGFSPQTVSGILSSGQTSTVPPIMLAVAARITEVNVSLTREELAEEAEVELKIEEKQRVLGAIPNFYVSYNPNAAPLTARQKFELAVKNVIDPFTFVIVGGTAGIEQAQDHFRGYGQGALGYAQRFAANYGDTLSGTFIGGAILPALLKQDPRYFYKGTGTFRARALYAIANSVICKGDNRKWQPNYSNVLGSLAAGGISNLYYPAQDRDGATLTFENAAIGIGANAVFNLMQEFVVRHFTPKLPKLDSGNPGPIRN